ncbi:hypothetical protein BHE74_00035849 [Ensete ventricosum]|nr:hypothetical protein BHE74_00035849 [Ensete ventricosum]
MIRSMVSPESHFKAQLNPPYSRHSGEGRCVPLVPDVGTHLIETLIPSLARGQAPDRRRPWPPHLALSFDLSLGRSLLLDLALLCCFVLLMLPSSVVDGVVVAGVSRYRGWCVGTGCISCGRGGRLPCFSIACYTRKAESSRLHLPSSHEILDQSKDRGIHNDPQESMRCYLTAITLPKKSRASHPAPEKIEL